MWNCGCQKILAHNFAAFPWTETGHCNGHCPANSFVFSMHYFTGSHFFKKDKKMGSDYYFFPDLIFKKTRKQMRKATRADDRWTRLNAETASKRMPLKSNNELNLFSLKKYSNALRVPAQPRQVGGCDRGSGGTKLIWNQLLLPFDPKWRWRNLHESETETGRKLFSFQGGRIWKWPKPVNLGMILWAKCSWGGWGRLGWICAYTAHKQPASRDRLDAGVKAWQAWQGWPEDWCEVDGGASAALPLLGGLCLNWRLC